MVKIAKTQREQIEEMLRKLATVGQVEGSAVVSRDGLVIASNITEIDADTFAAMSAAMQGAAETAASELRQGEGEMSRRSGRTLTDMGYLGPAGTSTEAAAAKFFGEKQAIVPVSTVPETLQLLKAGKFEAAVVPLENTIGGWTVRDSSWS